MISISYNVPYYIFNSFSANSNRISAASREPMKYLIVVYIITIYLLYMCSYFAGQTAAIFKSFIKSVYRSCSQVGFTSQL